MANTRQTYMKYSLMICIIYMGFIIAQHSMQYLTGVLGACTIYILVRKQLKHLTIDKGMKKIYAALLLMGEVLLCFLIPAFIVVWIISSKLTHFDLNINHIIDVAHGFAKQFNEKTNMDILTTNNIPKIASYATKFAQIAIDQVGSFVINSVVMLFILFFMLIGSEPMEKYMYELLPFNQANKRRVIDEIDKMVKSNAIGIPLLAIIQGFFATIGYIIFGAPNPLLLGFVTCFATIIPMVGTALVWVPLAIFLATTGHTPSAIGIALYFTIFISNVDNFVRFLLQKKLAKTHPLITVFGVIVGLTIFGFWGVIIGPLFFSMFFLCFDIYKKQYIDSPRPLNQIEEVKSDNA